MVLVVAVVCAAAITLLRLREVPGIGQELGSECGTNKEQVLAVENGDGYKCAVATELQEQHGPVQSGEGDLSVAERRLRNGVVRMRSDGRTSRGQCQPGQAYT